MKKLYLILLNILIIFLIACGGSSGESELEHPDKSPESLNDVSTGIDDIGSSLDEIERLIMDIPLADEDDMDDDLQEQDQEQGQEQETQEQEQDQEPQQPQDPQQAQAQQSQKQAKSEEKIKNEKLKKAWEEIEKRIEEIHQSWNEYEVLGQKKGATREQLDSFENALNRLTRWISERNLGKSYGGISQNYLSLRPLFDLYLDDIMGELTNLKYDTYRAYTRGMNNEEDSFEIFENNEDLYTRIKHKLDEESKNDLISRLENSITSLKKGLKEDSRRVNMIKKNIVLENIKELEE